MQRSEFWQRYISSNCFFTSTCSKPPWKINSHNLEHDKNSPDVCASGFDGQFGEATYHSLSFFLTARNLVKFEKLGTAHSWGNFLGVDWGLKWREVFGWEYVQAKSIQSEWFEWISINTLWFRSMRIFMLVIISTTQILWHKNTFFQMNKGRDSKQQGASVNQGNYNMATMEAALLKRSLIS